jgi:MtN3 and saliva related transmembrane protein
LDFITVIGLVAAVFTTVSLFPQLIRSWRTRSKPSGDSTFITYSMLFCVGIFLWLIYGIYKSDLPMMVANSLSFLQGLLILIIQTQRLRISQSLDAGSIFPSKVRLETETEKS